MFRAVRPTHAFLLCMQESVKQAVLLIHDSCQGLVAMLKAVVKQAAAVGQPTQAGVTMGATVAAAMTAGQGDSADPSVDSLTAVMSQWLQGMQPVDWLVPPLLQGRSEMPVIEL